MDQPMISSQEVIKPEYGSQAIKVIVGSVETFKGVPEWGDYNKQAPVVDAWSQTEDRDFYVLNKMTLKDIQLQREKILENQIKVLEENLRIHTELLSQIHSTSAKTATFINNGNFLNNPSASNTFHNRSTQVSPKVVKTMNSTHQVSSSPAESVKYMIIAAGTGNGTEEPIELQLAQEDGSLNLNSSGHSGRLEVCLTPREHKQIKTECNTVLTQKCMPLTSLPTTSPNAHQRVPTKRRLTTSTTNDKEQYAAPLNNITQQSPIENCHYTIDNLIKTPKTQDINVNYSMNTAIGPNNGTNSSPLSDPVIDKENAMVSIGPNNTRIPANLYENINWTSASIATRKLLRAIFGRNVLATHSMTGRPSPAFKDHDKPAKQMLDPLVVADIIYTVTSKCNVSEKEVRSAITTKCADENKMMKLQINKLTAMREEDKENFVE